MPHSHTSSQQAASSSPIANSSPSASTAPSPKRTHTQTSRNPTPQSTTASKPQRLPAPTLFVGPPSRNASHLSIARPAIDNRPTTSNNDKESSLTQNRPPLPTPALSGSKLNDPLLQRRPNPETGLPDAQALEAAGEGLAAERRKQHGENPSLRRPSDKSIDAKWREMQNSLNEVELTAQSSTHVFGQSHAAALDELRKAQVELARAWGRGNEDKSDGVGVEGGPMGQMGGQGQQGGRFKEADEIAGDRASFATGRGKGGKGRERANTGASVQSTASTTLSDEEGSSVQGSPGGHSKGSGKQGEMGKSALEDETAHDIKLASERRAANDRYFAKVDMAVKDVVQKLEGVAEAMRGVEGESRSLWSGSSGASGATEDGIRRASTNESYKSSRNGETFATPE